MARVLKWLLAHGAPRPEDALALRGLDIISGIWLRLSLQCQAAKGKPGRQGLPIPFTKASIV